MCPAKGIGIYPVGSEKSNKNFKQQTDITLGYGYARQTGKHRTTRRNIMEEPIAIIQLKLKSISAVAVGLGMVTVTLEIHAK